jgi:hypothetical protein
LEQIEGRVKAVVNSSYLRQTLAFKQGTREELEEEMSISQTIKNALGEHPLFGTAKPIAIIEHNGTSYLASMYSQGKDLYEQKEIRTFERTAEFLRIIHNTITTGKERDYRKVTEQRIANHPALARITQEPFWQERWNMLQGDYRYRRDAHGGNWICNTPLIEAIDLENKGKDNLVFDLIRLTVQSALQGEEEGTRQVIKAYGADKEIEEQYLLALAPWAIGSLAINVSGKAGTQEQKRVNLMTALRAERKLGRQEFIPYLEAALA